MKAFENKMQNAINGTSNSGYRTVEDFFKEILGSGYDDNIARNRILSSILPHDNASSAPVENQMPSRFNSIREVADYFRKQSLEEARNDEQDSYEETGFTQTAPRQPAAFGSIRELAQAFREGWRPAAPISNIFNQPDSHGLSNIPANANQNSSSPFEALSPFLARSYENVRNTNPKQFVYTALTPEQGRKIIEASKSWKGVPYLYGGKTRSGIDCSNFVYNVFSEAGFPYSYTSTRGDWKKQGFKEVNNPQPGDVILWNSFGHCGIVIDPVSSTFIGAQTTGGVSEANYNDSYWRKHHRTFLRYHLKSAI